jgi:hypothetical protein
MQEKGYSVGDARDGLTPEEEHKVEVKIDKMLDIKQPDTPEPEKPAESDEALPPIDIFSDPKTAPDVPDEVLKTVGHKEEHEKDEKLLPAEASPDGPDPLADPKTDKLVDEITAKEGDEVLAAEDAKIVQKAFEPKKSFGAKIKNFFAGWWGNKRARWTSIAAVVVLVGTAAILPTSRSFALNLVGVRATAEVTVLDSTTNLPLKGATVQLGSQTGQTDKNGNVSLSHVKLGSQMLTVQKVAFATSTTHVSLGLGTNHLDQVALKAVGAQYHFTVVDYVSGKPVTSASATSGEANAVADKKGNIVLTADSSGAATLDVSISAKDYHTTKVSVPIGTTATTTVQLVLAREEVYISKQSGKYDVYKSDIDGQHKTLLLAGTGNENDQISLVSHPTDEVAALISTRDNTRDSGGYLEQALTIINVDDGSDLTIDHSDRIQIIDWIGDRLVYAKVNPGASAGNPQRYLLMSYDYATKQRLTLAHANYFNDVVSANGVIYYASSNGYSGGVSQFAKVNPDSTGSQVLLTNEVWNIFRQDYDDFALDTATNWYTFALGSSKPASTPNAPANANTSRLYIDSPDGKHSLWVDTRDGKGALISYDTTAQKDTVLTEQSGLTYPVRWLNDTTVIYRISTPSQSADYVVSLSGGTPKKIADVTNAAGITRWYYY